MLTDPVTKVTSDNAVMKNSLVHRVYLSPTQYLFVEDSVVQDKEDSFYHDGVRLRSFSPKGKRNAY